MWWNFGIYAVLEVKSGDGSYGIGIIATTFSFFEIEPVIVF